jgi:hypothetical protein
MVERKRDSRFRFIDGHEIRYFSAPVVVDDDRMAFTA